MSSIKFKQKNFLPTLILIVGLWILLALIIFFVDPSTQGAVIIFLITFGLAFFLSISLVLANTRRGLFITITLVTILTLKYLDQGNILNLILVLGSALAFEIYFSTRA